jgi:uncharacterized protein YjiS (DUF1127 family)
MQDINNIRFSYASGAPRQASWGPAGLAHKGNTAVCDTESPISRLDGGLAHIGGRLARLIGTIELALQVRRERRILLGMDDRMLKDLGLNGTAYAEATRPFWDVPADRLYPRSRAGAREQRASPGICR